MAMAFTDAKEPDNPIVFANDSFLSLTGFDRTEVLGRSLNSLLARGADPDATARVSDESPFSGHRLNLHIGFSYLARRKWRISFCPVGAFSPLRMTC
jgi:PAS domain-containing protein